MAAKTTVQNKQNMFDMCLQESGGYASLFELAQLNDTSITDVLESGGDLLAAIPVSDPDILDYYTRNVISPATGNADALGIPVLGGIGYMAIGQDFIVS